MNELGEGVARFGDNGGAEPGGALEELGQVGARPLAELDAHNGTVDVGWPGEAAAVEGLEAIAWPEVLAALTVLSALALGEALELQVRPGGQGVARMADGWREVA